jgi:acyl carrier protein
MSEAMNAVQIDKETVMGKLAAFLRIPANRIDETMRIKGIVPDSFMLVELMIEMQEEYGIRLMQEDVENIDTVADLIQLIVSRARV